MNRARMMIYIDLYNIECASLEYRQKGLFLDYYSLIKELSDGYEIRGIKVYDSDSQEDDVLTGFHTDLADKGYDMNLFKPGVTKNKDGSLKMLQKEVDTSIVADSICDAYSDSADIFLIVSGDRDMCPAIRKIRGLGKRVVSVAFEDSCSECVTRESSESFFIEDLQAMEFVSVLTEEECRNISSGSFRKEGFS